MATKDPLKMTTRERDEYNYRRLRESQKEQEEAKSNPTTSGSSSSGVVARSDERSGIITITGGTAAEQAATAQRIINSPSYDTIRKNSGRVSPTVYRSTVGDKVSESTSSLIKRPEIVGSSASGGYLISQPSAFGGNITTGVSPISATFADRQDYYSYDSPLMASAVSQKKPVATSKRNTTIFADAYGGTYETIGGSPIPSGLLSINVQNKALSGGFSAEKGYTQTMNPLVSGFMEYATITRSSKSQREYAQRLGSFIGQKTTATALGAPGNILLSTQNILLSPKQRQVIGSTAFSSAERAGYISEETARSNRFGVTLANPTTYGNFFGSLVEQPPVLSGFGLSLMPSETRRFQQEGAKAFATEFLAQGGKPQDVIFATTQFRKRQQARVAGTEASLIAVGGVSEVTGRTLVLGSNSARQTGRLGATLRVSGATATAGFFEGATSSLIEQQTYTGRVNRQQVFLSGLSGSLSAGSISGTQFLLDSSAKKTNRALGKAFNFAVNAADLQEPLGDALGTQYQRSLRTRTGRSIFVNEPVLVTQQKDQGRVFSFVGEPVSTRSSLLTSTRTATRTQTSSNIFSSIVPITVSTRTRTNTNTRIKPATSVFANPFVTVPTLIPISTPTKTTTRTNVNVLAPDLPPFFGFPFGGGGSRSSNGRMSRQGQRLGYSATLGGLFFGGGKNTRRDTSLIDIAGGVLPRF